MVRGTYLCDKKLCHSSGIHLTLLGWSRHCVRFGNSWRTFLRYWFFNVKRETDCSCVLLLLPFLMQCKHRRSICLRSHLAALLENALQRLFCDDLKNVLKARNQKFMWDLICVRSLAVYCTAQRPGCVNTSNGPNRTADSLGSNDSVKCFQSWPRSVFAIFLHRRNRYQFRKSIRSGFPWTFLLLRCVLPIDCLACVTQVDSKKREKIRQD